MKNFLVLTLALASLGLWADATVDLSTLSSEYSITSSGTYTFTGKSENQDVYINVCSPCTVVLNGCTLENENFSVYINENLGEVNIQIVGNVTFSGNFYVLTGNTVNIAGIGCLNLNTSSQIRIFSNATMNINGGHFVCGNYESWFEDSRFIFAKHQNSSSPVVNINNATIDALDDLKYIVIVDGTDSSDNIHFNGGSICKKDTQPFVYVKQTTSTHDPKNSENNNVYVATLPDACTETNSYEYAATAEESATPYTTYTGPGHSESNDLFLPLPNGTYTVDGTNGKSYTGEINGGAATFAPVPEPCCVLLVLLASLGFLRRK